MTRPSDPIVHDLPVGPDDDAGCFRAYELWPGNVAATFQALRAFDDEGGRLAPLILSHGPECVVLAGLPFPVPWLLVRTTVESELDALRENLVVPLARSGLISVDFADHATALSRGGRIGLWHAYALNSSAAASRVTDAFSRRSSSELKDAAVLLHVLTSWSLAVEVFTRVAAALDHGLSGGDHEVLLIASASFHEQEHIEMRVMTVSGCQ